MTLNIIANLLAAICVLAGLFFFLVGAIGIVRFPDAYNRLHASSKCSTLGLLGLLLGVIFHVGTLGIVTKAILTMAFAFVANPVGSHILAKAAHMDGLKQWHKTLSDELAEDYPERTQRPEAADDDEPDLFSPTKRDHAVPAGSTDSPEQLAAESADDDGKNAHNDASKKAPQPKSCVA